MFQICEWASDLIECLLNVLKYNLGDVVKAKFHDVEMQSERILYILGLQKRDLDRVAEVIF
jgi:hypothetical protein